MKYIAIQHGKRTEIPEARFNVLLEKYPDASLYCEDNTWFIKL